MLKNLYTKLAGDPGEKFVKEARAIVEQKINPLEARLQKLSDAELRAKTDEFRARLKNKLSEMTDEVADLRDEFNNASDGNERRTLEQELKDARKKLLDAERAALDEILPEAFACAREAGMRTVGMRHYDVQMIGGMVLHQGKVAEMRTGEGKTLVATLPLYLNALLGRGAHLVTVNDYLARRDAQWMGPLYHALGLTVGVLQMSQGEQKALMFDPSVRGTTQEMNFMRNCTRQEAYACDIVYGTNSEFGFDYLRDNMAWRLEERVQRELYYAIVDEVDNILIDEARTPLIISGPAGEASDEYYRLAELVRKLGPDDYTIEQRTRGITLTEAGYDHVEQLLGKPITNPDRPEELDPQQAKTMHHLEAAMKAEYLFRRDKDYIVRKGQVIIVDEFTGRLMPGRRWSDGLHQAVEAKERVAIQQESVTYATVTLQNYFRMYQRLGGMTGTAKTEEDEFQKVYNLDVILIPTNKPMIRNDQADLIYRNEEAKWRAVIVEIASLYTKGQPTLVGTTSVEASEKLSKRVTPAKLQLYSRIRLLQLAIESNNALGNDQRNTLKAILSRSLDDSFEGYEEARASRLFHAYDLRAVSNAMRKLNKDARELARIKSRLLASSDKGVASVVKQFDVNEKQLKELDTVAERDLKFAAKLEERNIRIDGVEAMLDEIAAHPDDLAKLAQRTNTPLEIVNGLYQDLRLSRDEMLNVNRALIDSLGDAKTITDEYRVRPTDMDVIVKFLFVNENDVTRLAKKLEVNIDPFAPENLETLCEIFGVENSQVMSDVLHLGVPHNVLNAKEHEKEAGVIARAGEPHAITVATNMAGRGVDIKLGGELPEHIVNEVGRVLHKNGIEPYNFTFDQIKEALQKLPKESYELDKEPVEKFLKYMNDRAKVRELGGLRIIGTERHEARRIDNQLRGRSGRQGDPGSSRFYVSLEDEIMRRMGGKNLLDRVWTEDIPIEHDWVSKSIEQAQVKMEGYNFDIRKHLLDYDDVLNKQREIIYGQRYRVLTKADLRQDLRSWLEEEMSQVLAQDLKEEHGEARLLSHLDTMLPGFWLNENNFWPPYSIELIKRETNHSDEVEALKEKIADQAQKAMEMHRDFLTDVVVPEVVKTFEQQYRSTWDEIEDLAKNTMTTVQQEAEEQNRRADLRTVTDAIGQAIGMRLEVRGERGTEISQKDILDAVRRAYDARVVEQTYRRTLKRAGIEFTFNWKPDGALNFDALSDELTTCLDDTYTKIADKFLTDIERELDERVKSIDDLRGTRLANVLFGISTVRTPAFDQRTHRKIEIISPRFPWTHLAATQLKSSDSNELRGEILEYWNQSIDQLEPVRGGAATFNDLLRELMLSVVTNQWVDYLTAIEALREGIGLQAIGQRNPLVEYQNRAYAMFEDLKRGIRSQVVNYVFVYQYRGFARLESEARDKASRQVIEAPAPAATSQPSVATSQPTPSNKQSSAKSEQKKAEPTPKPVNATSGTKIGRNDPCWCGSGKKYKNCHMASDSR